MCANYYLLAMPRKPPATHCHTQLYCNSKHIFNLQKF